MTGSIERGRGASQRESSRASRTWWDAEADAYQEEHGAFLGDSRFVWGPEGLDEADARLLGPVEGRSVLEVGAGAAQCARWLLSQGARAVAIDLSHTQLVHAHRLDVAAGLAVPVAQADVCDLPFGASTFDLACSAYGAVPFVADVVGLHREIARVLRPGGRWVFSVTHPVRWAFPDVPGRAGLKVSGSYFDRRPYVETDALGEVSYVEHHRTLGDQVRALAAAGFVVVDIVEPEWPADNQHVWGGWSPLRGAVLPGTAIYSSVLAAT